MASASAALENTKLGQASELYDEVSNICQPCCFAGNNVQASKFCTECQEFLCTKCCTHHQALRLTRGHTLVAVDQARNTTTETIIPDDKCSRKCETHTKKTVKYFCVSHSCLGCSVCMVTDHKQCDNVEHIQTVAADITALTDFKDFNDSLTNLQNACVACRSNVKQTCEYIENDDHKLRETFKRFRKKVNDKLDEFENNLNLRSKESKDTEITKLKTLSEKIEESQVYADELIKEVNSLLLSEKRCDTYALLKTAVMPLESFEEELFRSVYGLTYQRVDFIPNNALIKPGAPGKLNTTAVPISSTETNKSLAKMFENNGPLTVKVLKKGTRVRRGKDWKWNNQDGDSSEGTILGPTENDAGWFDVKWDQPGGRVNTMWAHSPQTIARNNHSNTYIYITKLWDGIFAYRMGAEGAYDLNLVL